MKNKELVSIEEIRRGYIPFENGNFCYKVNGETFVKEPYSTRVYKKSDRFKREYLPDKNKDTYEMIIYKHVNKDYVEAVEEVRIKALETIKILNDLEAYLKIGTSEELLLHIIEEHKQTFKKVIF